MTEPRNAQVTNLKYLSKKTDIPLVQLTDSLDATVPDLGTTYSTLLTAEGLADIAKYATGVGPFKGTLIPTDPETNLLGESTNIAELIHDAGLQVSSLVQCHGAASGFSCD